MQELILSQTAQDHAAQLVRLKSAKDEADAKQIQMQKEMKEEVERLKTQFIFKVFSVHFTWGPSSRRPNV